MEFPVINIVDGMPTFRLPIMDIIAKCKKGWAVRLLTPAEYISYQQIKWWKGVLLRSLAEDSGNSMAYWETKLKTTVMPDSFRPEVIGDITIMPSVSSLPKSKMSDLIEGSVAQLHEWGFTWVTLPDSSLRKGK